jgi:hypothetical protein
MLSVLLNDESKFPSVHSETQHAMSEQEVFEKGQWDMFELITSAWYGKQYYFLEDNGVVYSRDTHSYLKDKDAAYNEFLNRINMEI